MFNLHGRKSGAQIMIDGKTWTLTSWNDVVAGWVLLSQVGTLKPKILYIADIQTGSVVWADKQVLEYVLNRRLYRITEKRIGAIITKVATAKDLAKSIRALAINIERL